MTNYDKIKKAVFLSDGRCVFEDDAPKYEWQQKDREELLASKDPPTPIKLPDKTTSGYLNWTLPWTQETQKKIDEKLAINRLYWDKLFNEECNKSLRTPYQPCTYTVANPMTPLTLNLQGWRVC